VKTALPERQTVILSAADVGRYLTPETCLSAVEHAFAMLGRGEAAAPSTLSVHVSGGVFHTKAGMLNLGRTYFVAKTNANFPGNPQTYGLPTIQGLVLLFDGVTGQVLAVIDSLEITARRTAAATALAARSFAPAGARVVAMVGCGFQAAYQLEALRAVVPFERVIAVDADAARAQKFADTLDCVAGSLEDAAAAEPDVWITCTTSYEFVLFPEHVKAGAFVAGVGVDNENKRELAPALMERAHVIADHAEQCAHMGDMHHTLAAGLQPRSVRELGKVAAGLQPGRTDDGIYVFDSTGIALQDVAACAAVFESAVAAEAERAQLTTVQISSLV
jgi:alanine dehydrogenase